MGPLASAATERMPSTLGTAAGTGNAPREELRRPPAGGRGCSRGTTPTRPAALRWEVRWRPRPLDAERPRRERRAGRVRAHARPPGRRARGASRARPAGVVLAAVATLPLLALGRRAARRLRADDGGERHAERARLRDGPAVRADDRALLRRLRRAHARAAARRRPRSSRPVRRPRRGDVGLGDRLPDDADPVRDRRLGRSPGSSATARQRRGRRAELAERLAAHSATRSASGGWPPPRSARGSPATCTTRRRTRST